MTNNIKSPLPKYFKKKGSKKAGLPPGSLIYVGERKEETVGISLISYSEHEFEEQTFFDIEECLQKINPNVKNWINIDGLHDVEIVEKIGNHFKLHALLLEDILNTDQRPKIDEYEDSQHLYTVIKMFLREKNQHIEVEQVSFVLGHNFVITFQEKKGDVFEPVRERLRQGRGRIRKRNCDYLTYALIDAVVDNYFTILEEISDRLENIEEALINNSDRASLRAIHNQRRELIILRKAVWPMREVISRLEKGELKLVDKQTKVYIRDLYDHTIQVMDNIETFRDILTGLHDMYMTNMSNKMNEIMKVLTIIATIFIPLTFIAGVYGMNFEYMPELQHPYGYFITWIVMIIVGLAMVVYFKRKNWL